MIGETQCNGQNNCWQSCLADTCRDIGKLVSKPIGIHLPFSWVEYSPHSLKLQDAWFQAIEVNSACLENDFSLSANPSSITHLLSPFGVAVSLPMQDERGQLRSTQADFYFRFL